jgi:ERCC4-type nuclease
MLLVSKLEPENVRATIASDVLPVDLATGDFFDTDTGLIVERKTVSDLLASIRDGRLYDQCRRMAAISDLAVLLVHGSLLADKDYKVIADGRTTRWSYWSILMCLMSVQAGGVMVMMVKTTMLADALDKLRKWAKKSDHRKIRKTKGIWLEPSDALKVMGTLVGLETGKLILKEYGSPYKALQHIDEWSSIKGIGPKTIDKAKQRLGINEELETKTTAAKTKTGSLP